MNMTEIEQTLAEADCLASPNQVDDAIDRLASGITAQLKGSNPIVFCVMNGGMVVAGRLLCKLSFPLEVAYLHATRYGQHLNGSLIEWRVQPTQDVRDRAVLVIDDIHDEGYTLDAIVDHLRSQGATSVHTAVLVHKLHDRKSAPGMRADFSGLDIEDRYLFGCGMDYKGYWRNAPGIYAPKGL